MSSNIKIAAGAMVCTEAELEGDITIGARTVVHPKARIIAEAGPIVIGENNLIEEQCLIINRFSEASQNQKVMIVGNNNVFEVGCYSEALKIGDNNVIESKARIGRDTELTSGCIIGAMCDVTSPQTVAENTVVFGTNCSRRVQSEKPPPQTLQLDFLTKIIPNYHHIRKAMKPVQNM